MVSMSPRVKITVMRTKKPNSAFTTKPSIRDTGRVLDESLVSSAEKYLVVCKNMLEQHYLPICTEQSRPSRDNATGSMPIIMDKPSVLHPPLLVKSRKTEWASPSGASTHSGITMTTPKIWRSTSSPSIRGSFFARIVLKMMAKKAIPITSKVP